MTTPDSNKEYKKLVWVAVVVVVVLLAAMFIGMAISDAIYHSKK